MTVTNRTMELKRYNNITCGCKLSPAYFCTSMPTGLVVQEIVNTMNFEKDMKALCNARDSKEKKGESLNA